MNTCGSCKTNYSTPKSPTADANTKCYYAYGVTMKFVDKTTDATINPFGGEKTIGSWTNCVSQDVNGDGKVDLVIGSWANIEYYKNTGTITTPSAVTAQTFDATNPFYALRTSNGGPTVAHPIFWDVNNDGLTDLILGQWNAGVIRYVKGVAGAGVRRLTGKVAEAR